MHTAVDVDAWTGQRRVLSPMVSVSAIGSKYLGSKLSNEELEGHPNFCNIFDTMLAAGKETHKHLTVVILSVKPAYTFGSGNAQPSNSHQFASVLVHTAFVLLLSWLNH